VAVSINILARLIFGRKMEQIDFGIDDGSNKTDDKDRIEIGPECSFFAAVIVESVDGVNKLVSDGSATTSVETAC